MAKKRSRGCARTIVKFKTRRGKSISFPGHQGSSCAPRKTPSTRHLRPYKEVMAKAAPQCARRHGGGTRAFRKCVGQAVKSIEG